MLNYYKNDLNNSLGFRNKMQDEKIDDESRFSCSIGKLKQILLTVYLFLITGISYLFTFLICLILYPFISQKTMAKIYEVIPRYAALYSMTLPGFWTITLTDLRKNKKWNTDDQYVIVANHMSLLDSPLLVLLPLTKKFMVARIFSQIPVFAWLCRQSGYIFVDRNDKTTTINAVDRAIETIGDGSSFCIFPEGIREKVPYQFEKFKTGAFRIAYRKQIPILPITIYGSERAIHLGPLADTAHIHLFINDPFPVEDEDYDKYIEKTRNIMLENIGLCKSL